ncbi:MAG: lysylphosphatidylglycerol synthase domain-containing protein [Myxococcales bacterium]
MTSGPLAFLRRPWGRAAAAAVGVGFVSAVLWRLGPERVLAALARSAPVFPICLALEGAMLACSLLGLRTLYGRDRSRLSAGTLAYAGLLGYVTMLLVPAGRAFAEVARATVLSRRSTGARAAHAAYQAQAACLFGNAVISAAAFAAALRLVGPRGYSWAIGANSLLAAGLGGGMLLAGRRGGLGGLLGRIVPSAQDFGASFDGLARESSDFPWGAVLWESASRGLQTIQFALMVAAVGGAFSPSSGLVAEGTHLVGAALGDLIPAQLGAAEINFAVFAHVLGIDSAGAVAVALLDHLAQLGWFLVGLGAILAFRPDTPADTVDEPAPTALEVLR